MALDFESFDASVKATRKLKQACSVLGLDEGKCRQLEGMVSEIYGEMSKTGKTGKLKRKLSRWQQCVAEYAKGKKFGKETLAEASRLYKAGKCPVE